MLDSVCQDGDFLAIAVGDEASNCIMDDKVSVWPVKVQAPFTCPSCVSRTGGLPPPAPLVGFGLTGGTLPTLF